MTRQALVKAALKLPTDAKIELADELLASIDPAEQKAVDDAWAAEIERRIAAVERGEAKMIPFEKAMRELRAKRRKKR